MTTRKRSKRNPEAAPDNAYIKAHDTALSLLDEIREHIFEIGPPGDKEFPIGWDDVATLNEVNRQLAEVVAFLDSIE